MKIIDENYVLGNYDFFSLLFIIPFLWGLHRLLQTVMKLACNANAKCAAKLFLPLIMDEGGKTAGGGRAPQPTHTGAGQPPPHVLISIPGEETLSAILFLSPFVLPFPWVFLGLYWSSELLISVTLFLSQPKQAGSQILSLPCLLMLSNNQSTGKHSPGCGNVQPLIPTALLEAWHHSVKRSACIGITLWLLPVEIALGLGWFPPPPEIPTWPMNVVPAVASLWGDHAERSHLEGWGCLKASSTSSWTLLVACRCSWGVWCIPGVTSDTESASCTSYKNQFKSVKWPPFSHSACRGSKQDQLVLRWNCQVSGENREVEALCIGIDLFRGFEVFVLLSTGL